MLKTKSTKRFNMKRFFSILFCSIFLASIPLLSFAEYNSNICKGGDKCSGPEVGVFMEGVSKTCGNLGKCTLEDIMMVFANTGNFILEIIAGLVLLMYVLGGFYMLSSGGSSERIQKGKKYIKTSTVGLLIVMFAYLGIMTLKGELTGQGVSDKYVVCDGTKDEDIKKADDTYNKIKSGVASIFGMESPQKYISDKTGTEGKLCSLNSVCKNGACLTKCEAESYTPHSCQNVDPKSAWVKKECLPNKCPGKEASMLCCPF